MWRTTSTSFFFIFILRSKQVASPHLNVTGKHTPEHISRPHCVCALSRSRWVGAICLWGWLGALVTSHPCSEVVAPADSHHGGHRLVERIIVLSLRAQDLVRVSPASSSAASLVAHTAVALFIPLLPLLSHKEKSTIPEFLKANAPPACWPWQFWQLGKGMRQGSVRLELLSGARIASYCWPLTSPAP